MEEANVLCEMAICEQESSPFVSILKYRTILLSKGAGKVLSSDRELYTGVSKEKKSSRD